MYSRESETFPIRQDPCHVTNSAHSAAQLFSTFPAEEGRGYFNEPPVDDDNSELLSILTL